MSSRTPCPSPRRPAIPPSQNLHLLADPSTSQGNPQLPQKTPTPHGIPISPRNAPNSSLPGEPPLHSSLTPPGAPGPSLTSRLLHRAPVHLAVALQRGDVRGLANLGRRRPTPHTTPGPNLLPASAPAAAPAPLLRKPHRFKVRAR